MSGTLSRLPESLARRSEQAAARRSQSATPDSPPLIAAQSPLHEIFIDEISASLPGEILQRMKTANQVAGLHDWFAAAALYRWVQPQPDVARDFLTQLGSQPCDAGLTLVAAMARKLESPPPQPEARELDVWGAAWQSVAVAVLWIIRLWLVMSLSAWLTRQPLTWAGAAESFQILVRGEWIAHSLLEALAGSVVFAGWLCLEGALAPGVIHFIRELPFDGTSVAYRRGWQMEGLVLHSWLQPLLLQLSLAIVVAIVLYRHWRQLTDIASICFAIIACSLILWMLHFSARAGSDLLQRRCLLPPQK